jgi:hypothetical protein
MVYNILANQKTILVSTASTTSFDTFLLRIISAVFMGVLRKKTPQALVAKCLDHVALEGKYGISLKKVFEAVDEQEDFFVRRQLWHILRRQQKKGILSFFYQDISKKDKHKVGQENVRSVLVYSRM